MVDDEIIWALFILDQLGVWNKESHLRYNHSGEKKMFALEICVNCCERGKEPESTVILVVWNNIRLCFKYTFSTLNGVKLLTQSYII